MGLSENSVPLNPMVNDHYPYEKLLFHWGYTPFLVSFQILAPHPLSGPSVSPRRQGAQGGAAAAATALRLFGELPAPTAPAFTAAIASCGVAREWEQLGDAKAIGTSLNLGK